MATCTPVYGLAMVDCSDRPCDIDDTMCQFAKDVEAQLDALDSTLDRTFVTVPIAQIRRTETFVRTVGESGNNFPTFDTVVADTDNMVDLTSNSTGFTIQTAGVYYVWYAGRGTIALPSGGGASPSMSVSVIGLSSGPFPFDGRYGGFAGAFAITGATQVSVPAGSFIAVSLGAGGTVGNTNTYTDIHLGAMWIGDVV
jgi:hypothetical protein